MILLERDRHKIGKMFYFWLIYFFLVFRSGSFSCISDKKASESVRVQARDYLLKIFRSRWVAGNRQSDPISVFDQRYLLIRLWYLRGFLVLQFFTLIFVIKGVPRRGGGGVWSVRGLFRSIPGCPEGVPECSGPVPFFTDTSERVCKTRNRPGAPGTPFRQTNTKPKNP